MIKSLLSLLIVFLAIPAFGIVLHTKTGVSAEGELNYFDSNKNWVVLDTSDGRQVRLSRRLLTPNDALIVKAMMTNFQKIQANREQPLVRQVPERHELPETELTAQSNTEMRVESTPAATLLPQRQYTQKPQYATKSAYGKPVGKPKRSYMTSDSTSGFFEDPETDLSATKAASNSRQQTYYSYLKRNDKRAPLPETKTEDTWAFLMGE